MESMDVPFLICQLTGNERGAVVFLLLKRCKYVMIRREKCEKEISINMHITDS